MTRLVVGLTGTLGSGKSTVAQLLAERGASIVDMDEAGRWAVGYNERVQHAIRKTFGDSVFDDAGRLKRRALGDIVFSDHKALTQLNKIVHPAMLERVRFLVDKEKNAGDSLYIIVDAALIFELEFEQECDLTVCVTASLEQRLERAGQRNFSRQQALDRIHSQIPQHEKAARSDYVLKNDTTLETLQKRVKELHLWLLQKIKE